MTPQHVERSRDVPDQTYVAAACEAATQATLVAGQVSSPRLRRRLTEVVTALRTQHGSHPAVRDLVGLSATVGDAS